MTSVNTPLDLKLSQSSIWNRLICFIFVFFTVIISFAYPLVYKIAPNTSLVLEVLDVTLMIGRFMSPTGQTVTRLLLIKRVIHIFPENGYNNTFPLTLTNR